MAKHRAAHRAAATPKLRSKEEVIVNWQAPEYIHHEKSVLWFVLATIVAFALIVNAILSKQWISAIVFALLLGVIYLFAHDKPKEHVIVISNLGIHVGRHFHPFADIKSFWLIYHERAQTFNI